MTIYTIQYGTPWIHLCFQDFGIPILPMLTGLSTDLCDCLGSVDPLLEYYINGGDYTPLPKLFNCIHIFMFMILHMSSHQLWSTLSNYSLCEMVML